MSTYVPASIVLALILLMSALSFFWDAPVAAIETIVGEHRLLGAVLFGTLMFCATVVAPITMLPLMPVVAPALGPMTTAIAGIVGWTLGAIVAFLIARHAGRPLLARFVSLDTIARYESFIPKEAQFFTVLILRVVIPVDVLSYALGLLSTIRLRTYALATVLGVSYFAFVFAYLGVIATEKNLFLFGGVAGVSLLLFFAGWWYLLKKRSEMRKDKVADDGL